MQKEIIFFLKEMNSRVMEYSSPVRERSRKMKKLREMRNPLKYVQGRDALLSFCKETGYMGKKYLLSAPIVPMKPAMKNWKKVLKEVIKSVTMRFLAAFPASPRLPECGKSYRKIALILLSE